MNNTIPRATAVSTIEEHDDNAHLENGLLVVMAIFLFGALMAVFVGVHELYKRNTSKVKSTK